MYIFRNNITYFKQGFVIKTFIVKIVNDFVNNCIK